MILYCTTNRDLELWYLDLVGALARPPASPAVYALVSFEAAAPRNYVGSRRRFTARLSAHLSFARSRQLRGHTAGGSLLAPVVARRRRVLVVILETCAGATIAALHRREQAWLIAANRDCGAAALPYQIPASSVLEGGPHAPATLAAGRDWPTAWVEALASFFREPRTRQHPAIRQALNGAGKTRRASKSGAAAHQRRRGTLRRRGAAAPESSR